MTDIIARKDDQSDLGRIGKVSGALGSLGRMRAVDVLPPLLGGTISIGTTLLVRKYGKSKPNLMKYAPLLGAGAGILGSVPLYWWRGYKAVISGAVTGAVAGVGLFAFERASQTQWMTTAGIGRYVVTTRNRRQLPGQVRGTHIVESPHSQGRVQPTAESPGGFDLSGFGANV